MFSMSFVNEQSMERNSIRKPTSSNNNILQKYSKTKQKVFTSLEIEFIVVEEEEDEEEDKSVAMRSSIYFCCCYSNIENDFVFCSFSLKINKRTNEESKSNCSCFVVS